MFRVLYTPHFERLYEKIVKSNPSLQFELEKNIIILATDPFNISRQHRIKKLKGVSDGDGAWRLRFGRFRIRYDVEKEIVILYSIKDRKDAYK